jgi:murein DD-endopeptidase MepM/ murein hydrolase activator NlpD
MQDDTSYSYWLPYEKGHSYFLVQAANSKMSHKNELALDFKMKKGSKICAAREGVVIDAHGDSNKGGLKEENLADGNYIIILHNDSSIAKYWHMDKDGVYVTVGEYIKKGQIIGSSGNTGYTAFPHLHFQVNDNSGKQIMVRFRSRSGDIYLRPGKWYRGVH